jgi:two-component system phosphate regulon sensor histidine kinase PhoR
MKRLKPRILLVFICITVGATSFIFELAGLYLSSNPVLSTLLTSLLLGLITYLLLYFGIKFFIQHRLSTIFKTIQNPPHVEHTRLDHHIEDAENQVSLMAAEKAEEIRQLKSQDVFRKEFIGNLSHELKTPVFSIQGYIDSLLNGAMEDPEVAKNFLIRASKASDRMTKLLEDLDDITKLENPDYAIEKRPFDLPEAITEAIETIEWMANEKNITLRIKKSDNTQYVLGDRNKIIQVFVNLIKNSISYGNNGGKTEILLNAIDNMVVIQVVDDGIGIDPKHWARLYERFYRVEQSRNRHEGGTGLGLSIVKHILDLHGQNITMRSTVGIGTTFSFTLERSSKNIQLSSRGIPIK